MLHATREHARISGIAMIGGAEFKPWLKHGHGERDHGTQETV